MTSTLHLLSDEQVNFVAAFDITDTCDLHDPRFGNAGNTEVICPTCGMRSDACMGHHASMSLGVSMFHPLMYKSAQKIVNNTCFGCGTSLDQKIKSKLKRCHICDTVNHGDYIVYAHDLSAAVRPNGRDVKYADSIPSSMMPDGYVLSRVLVPPVHLRTPEDMEWSTDIQKLYEQLVHTVKKKGDVCAAYSKITGAHKNEGVTGIMSGKPGIFRNLMMGKRVELSARAVITGDPNVELDQVAVPTCIASNVKVRAICNKYNVNNMMSLADNNRLWWEGTQDVVNRKNILPGMTFERQLSDGDVVMFNRQPSLSKDSLACFKVVIRRDEENVFGMNPQATPPFNADFDGDEMNLFFMSQSSPYACKAEMLELCCAHNTVPVQDVVTGCYIMSSADTPVSKYVWDDCHTIVSALPTGQIMSTHGLLKLCIPDYKGEILCKNNIGISDLYTLQLVVERWLSVYGLTVSLSSLISQPLAKVHTESPDAYKERCVTKVVYEMRGKGIMNMIESGAKGSTIHAANMAVALGQQYVGGKEGVFCNRSYSRGLTPNEFFGHQMAAREGVVSTNIGTANTGYLNRRACIVLADLKRQYNGTVADNVMLSSFE